MSADRIATALQEQGEAVCIGESLATVMEAVQLIGLDPREIRVGLQGVYIEGVER